MKGKIYLYLFVFSILVNVFQYVNSKGIIDKYEKDIKKFKAKIEVLEKSDDFVIDSINTSYNIFEDAVGSFSYKKFIFL